MNALLLTLALALPQDKDAQRPPIYDEKADGEQQIAAALARATKENRRVLVQWGANWCSWCHHLHGAFKKDKDLSRELSYEYDVVLLDVGKRDKHMDLALKYGVDLKEEGIPYLTILDSGGKVLANQETAGFETKIDGQDGHDAKRIVELLKKHEAQPWKAETLLADALARAKAEDKRVFLHFGAPW